MSKLDDTETQAAAFDQEEFRRVLGHLPTGVTVITAETPAGPVGMAANSFSSASLDPPLILFCPAKSSTTWPLIRAGGRCCVNVMAGHQAELTRRFSLKDLDRFADVAYTDQGYGPRLASATAWLDCTFRDEHDAGDHTIVVAAVVAMGASGDSAPLVFHRGAYGTFAPGDPRRH